jgi:integrase
MEKPPCLRRERILTLVERRAILAAVHGRNFKMFLFALGQTGCRPGEVAAVTAEHFHPSGMWVFHKHKTRRKTGRPRVVYLSRPMIKLTQLLMRLQPEGGALFRNDEGRPWNRNSIRCRFRRLKDRVGIADLCAYHWRHTYATDALERGVPIATVAQLLGHTSTSTIARHYGHLDQKVEHLRQAVELVTRPPGR